MNSIDEVLNNPPPDVDLTLVGGQAVIFWTMAYRDRYPDLFPDDIISSTFDIDFVVKFKGACELCAEHWGGKLRTPGWGDATPELGVIYIEQEDDDEIRIDLLPDLLRIEKNKIDKLRSPMSEFDGGTKFKDMHVLSEWGTLLNRANNSAAMSKYQKPEAIIQLRNAIAIMRARILWSLDEANVAVAQSEVHAVLHLASTSKIGMTLYLKHGVDLLDCIPLEDDRYEERFKDFALIPGLRKIDDKRSRLAKAWGVE